MTEQTFQVIITASVVLAVVALVVQGILALALYRASREMAARFAPALAHLKSILKVENEAIRRGEIVIDKTLLFAEIMERMVPKLGVLAGRAEALAGRAGAIPARVSDLQRSVELVETATHFMAVDLRPRITSVKDEASALVRTAGEQGRRVGLVFRDAITHWIHLRETVAFR